jgi:hypothetical protein
LLVVSLVAAILAIAAMPPSATASAPPATASTVMAFAFARGAVMAALMVLLIILGRLAFAGVFGPAFAFTALLDTKIGAGFMSMRRRFVRIAPPAIPAAPTPAASAPSAPLTAVVFGIGRGRRGRVGRGVGFGFQF